MTKAISINRKDEVNQEVTEILDAMVDSIAKRVHSVNPRAERIILAATIENCLEYLQWAKELLPEGVL